ncbi:MAG: nuclear transport factor 2 family protein [Paucimonas sp.]|nr:nuclear transport factor 2 family protein [Paucimonas sp.]
MGTEQNKQLVMRGYEMFGQQDIEGLLSLYADDIEWVGYEEPEVPFSGTYRGKAGVRQFFADLAQALDVERFEAKQAIAEGDKVVVLGHAGWKVRDSGELLDYDWVHVFDVKDGLVRRFQHFDDGAQLARAFGGLPMAGRGAARATSPGSRPMQS